MSPRCVFWATLVASLGLAFGVSADTSQVWLHTRDVYDLKEWQGALWVASSGGIERYPLATLEQSHHLTQAHGLDSAQVLALEVRDEQLFARTPNALCKIALPLVQCSASRGALGVATLRPSFAGSVQGAPISVQLPHREGTFVGTRGRGVWLRKAGSERMLTPASQICTNHVQALQLFRGELWLGGFRDGLCVRRGDVFVKVATPFRFINALLSFHDALYVAANEGLYRSLDGQLFERVLEVRERGANGLAGEGDTLWVTTPAALHALSVASAPMATRIWRTPGGSTALQAVSVRAGQIWLASEDRGALHVDKHGVRVFDALSGLDSSWVLDVAIDAHGTVYAATLRHGLFAIDRAGSVRAIPLASPWLLRLGWVRGELWIGSQEGLLTESALRGVQPALPGACVHALLELGDRVWVGTESGTFALSQAPDALQLSRL